MSSHTAGVPVAAACRAAGLTVLELDGWEQNQPGYYWVDEHGNHHGYTGRPVGHMIHHTATATYVPYVRNAAGQTKANVWAGLWRDGRLHQTAPGVPTLVMASAGPANHSSGTGVRQVLTDHVAADRRYPGPQRSADTPPSWAGNRHYWNTEIIHRGDGTALDQGVWNMIIRYCEALSTLYGWSKWRHIGHNDHTRRKIDPRFAQGAPYTIAAIQNAIHTTGGGDDMSTIITALKAQSRATVQRVQQLTGTPAGDAGYWSRDGTSSGAKASDQEWREAAPTILAAYLEAGVVPSPGGSGGLTQSQGDARYVRRGQHTITLGG